MALTKNDLQAIKDVFHQELKVELKPIKDDIVQIKHVTEHVIYKEMKDGFRAVNDRIEILENQVGVIIEDHEPRIKHLEDHAGIS